MGDFSSDTGTPTPSHSPGRDRLVLGMLEVFYVGGHARPIAHAAYLFIDQNTSFGYVLWVGTFTGRNVEFFHAARRARRACIAYPLLVQTNAPDMRLGSIQHRKERVGRAEAMEREDIFVVTFALSFVSMIVLCGRERETCVEERGHA